MGKTVNALQSLPRPILRWICILIVLWVAGGCDIAGFPLDSTVRGILLGFVVSVYGLRGLEKIKGVE